MISRKKKKKAKMPTKTKVSEALSYKIWILQRLRKVDPKGVTMASKQRKDYKTTMSSFISASISERAFVCCQVSFLTIVTTLPSHQGSWHLVGIPLFSFSFKTWRAASASGFKD